MYVCACVCVRALFSTANEQLMDKGLRTLEKVMMYYDVVLDAREHLLTFVVDSR